MHSDYSDDASLKTGLGGCAGSGGTILRPDALAQRGPLIYHPNAVRVAGYRAGRQLLLTAISFKTPALGSMSAIGMLMQLPENSVQRVRPAKD